MGTLSKYLTGSRLLCGDAQLEVGRSGAVESRPVKSRPQHEVSRQVPSGPKMLTDQTEPGFALGEPRDMGRLNLGPLTYYCWEKNIYLCSLRIGLTAK